jgi:hypothetical protein
MKLPENALNLFDLIMWVVVETEGILDKQ